MRYFRLYLHFLRFSFARFAHFRFDSFFRIGMDIVTQVVHLSFFYVVFRHTGYLDQWTAQHTYAFAASFLFVDAIYMTVFANGNWWFPIYVNRGDLDFYLTKPVSSWFFLILKDVSIDSGVNLLINSAILAYFLSPLDPTWWQALSLVLLLMNGTLLLATVRLVFIMSTFWTGSPRGFDDLFFSLQRMQGRPHHVYPGLLKRLILTALPMGLIASVPVQLVLVKFEPYELINLIVVSLLSYLVTAVVWRMALRRYSSASS